MTNAEVHAIQVQDTPVLQERTLTPSFKLLGERLVEPTDRTGTGSNSQQGLGHFPYFMGTGSGHEHLRESFSDVRFKATVPVKDLRMELAFAVVFRL